MFKDTLSNEYNVKNCKREVKEYCFFKQKSTMCIYFVYKSHNSQKVFKGILVIVLEHLKE